MCARAVSLYTHSLSHTQTDTDRHTPVRVNIVPEQCHSTLHTHTHRQTDTDRHTPVRVNILPEQCNFLVPFVPQRPHLRTLYHAHIILFRRIILFGCITLLHTHIILRTPITLYVPFIPWCEHLRASYYTHNHYTHLI